MAKSYTALQQQTNKIRTALQKVTPPGPDDEFEDLRRSVFREMDRMDAYLTGRVTGGGSAQVPNLED